MSLQTADRRSAKFIWKIENFSRVYIEKLYSETFYVGGYKWRVLMFPKGNRVDYLSVYLEAVDLKTLPYRRSRDAHFGLSVINQIRNDKTVRKDTQHKFNAREDDWGFTSFLSLSELNDPGSGFLVNDTIVVEADVTVPKPGDSKMETQIAETGIPSQNKSSENVEADITETSSPSPQQPLQPTLGTLMAPTVEATAPMGKVKFLSYLISLEASLLLERVNSLHKETFTKFSMKGQALQTMLLESLASFIESMSTTKVNAVNEEELRLAAISIEDFEQVGLELSWLKQRLDEANRVNKHSESVITVESRESALNVARAKVRELEEGLATAKAEVEAISRELPESLGVNDSLLKDVV